MFSNKEIDFEENILSNTLLEFKSSIPRSRLYYNTYLRFCVSMSIVLLVMAGLAYTIHAYIHIYIYTYTHIHRLAIVISPSSYAISMLVLFSTVTYLVLLVGVIV